MKGKVVSNVGGGRIGMKYWVERWSELRNEEMVSYPKDFFHK